MANLSGAGAPTRNTVGALGDIYTNTETGQQYKCTEATCVDTYGTSSDKSYYSWIPVEGATWASLPDKPFYEEITVHQILKEKTLTDFYHRDSDDDYNVSVSDIVLDNSVEPGENCIVTWDGVDYEVPYVGSDDGGYLGFDMYDNRKKFTESEFPFGIFIRFWTNEITIVCGELGVTTHTVSIKKVEEKVKQIDSKFLPTAPTIYYNPYGDDYIYKDESCTEKPSAEDLLDAVESGLVMVKKSMGADNRFAIYYLYSYEEMDTAVAVGFGDSGMDAYYTAYK